MLPYDVTGLLRDALAANQRPPDGKLHPSSHLTGSLRHVQLEVAGAPTVERDLVADVNLAIGTAVHTDFERLFRGLPVMTEVKLDRWLPEGWSGTADWLFWDDYQRCFVLGDLKTTKPGGINWIHKAGAKDSHIWQISCYWHAVAKMGLPLAPIASVYYLPKNQLTASEGLPVGPTEQEIRPLPWAQVEAVMAERKAAVDAYVASLPTPQVGLHGDVRGTTASLADLYVTPALAPVQEREFDLRLNKTLKVPAIDVKLKPNWSTAYCAFPTELCDCREQKTNKVGQYDRDDAGLLTYTPSKGFEGLTPPQPDPGLVAAMVKAQKEKNGSA